MSTTDSEATAAQATSSEKGLIAYFAANPVAGNLLMLFLIVGGVIAGSQLPVQHSPELDLRTVMVTVAAPGSSPKEIEEDINRRIEESVVGLAGVERVVAVAKESLGRVEIELATFADADATLDDVKTAVGAIENFPPAIAEQPEVELKRAALEVMTLAVRSPAVSEDGLRAAAEDVRDELLALPSISQVVLRATRDREITIELSEEELRRNDLSITEVSSLVRRASLNLTFGELRTDAGGVVLHTVAKRRVGEEFEDIPLITQLDGTILTLGDVATIRDGFVDQDIRTRVDGEPAVLVRVNATEKQSIAEVADEIMAWRADYVAPDGVSVEVWNDRARSALDRISYVLSNAMIGTVLVFLLLVVVFDLRVAIWITVGILLSFVGALLFFDLADLTLNLGTIFALFLLVGIVVDDAVVVGESIAAERARGRGALAAAISGARVMVGPITVGVLTTIVALMPFLFVTAGVYQIVSVIPFVALFVLGVSLIEAFFILPAHLSHEKPWSLAPLTTIQHWVGERLDTFRDQVVAPAVSWSIHHVWRTLAIGALFVLGALVLLRSETVRIIVLNEGAYSAGMVQADLHLPVGSPFEQTLAVAERFVDAAGTINDQLEGTSVKSVSILVGNLVSTQTHSEVSNNSHLASVRLHLEDQSVRVATPVEVAQAWRLTVGDVSGLDGVEYQTSGIKPQPNVAYAIQHDDAELLREAATELTGRMAELPGLYEISDSLALGKRHLEIRITPAGKAAGLTPAAIGKQLRANFHGLEVQRIQRGREEIKVMVRYPAERRRSLQELASERIYRPGGGEVPLSLVAQLTERRELAEMTRIDGKQTALVSGFADLAVVTPGQARRAIAEQVIPDLVAKYPGLRIDIDGGARDERKMLETLGILVPMVLLAMYALMAAFLRSYWKPLIAVAGLPMAFAGAVFSHWVLGWDFTAMSIFGVIAVGGVIVNDALVLLDRYNILRRGDEMLPAIAAASAAARHRFRAVVLTSLTTVVGLSPLLYERSDELVFLVPFVVSMLGGLVFSTVFVLFLLPTLVMMVDGRRE